MAASRSPWSCAAGDDAVMATNDDASICKRHAVQLGYWTDKYLPLFVRSAERKAPEINRGYYARVQGIRKIVEKFIRACNKECQIVNLGAGFDTLYWRLKDENLSVRKFVEVDFPNIVYRKCFCIKNNPTLLEKLDIEEGACGNTHELHSKDYHIVAADLRNASEVEQKLVECGVDFQLPTVFLAECVLVYMKSQDSHSLVKSIADKFGTCLFINYEQANMRDKFGEVMMLNLKSRGCSLAGIDDCVSLESQGKRFTSNGWEGARVMDMLQVYHSLPFDDVRRIESLEFLDEVELLHQLLQHYCICVAWKDSMKLNLEALFGY